MNAKDMFDMQRFSRLLVIELSNYWKKVGLASGLVFALMMFIYSDLSDEAKTFSVGIFFIYIVVGGAIFTSVIFSDMHHPLERFQFLTLPCSQVERFASKYLVTGPLFLVYGLVLSWLFVLVAPGFARDRSDSVMDGSQTSHDETHRSICSPKYAAIP